jgi:hypothetical protein
VSLETTKEIEDNKEREKSVLFIELSIVTMMIERLWRIVGMTMAVETVVLGENSLPVMLFY